MLNVLHIVGARPQFIKVAVVSKAFAQNDDIDDQIIHTGQHYEQNMSDIFFSEMGIPEPAINLEVQSPRHGEMTGLMLAKIEAEIIERKPDCVLVYGDTNSTLAGALASTKINVPVAHIEAGLRSFNRQMPEEINRVLSDHVSNLLFCPTSHAVQNLKNENITSGVYHVGDVMYDTALYFGEVSDKHSTILSRLGLEQSNYYLATIHRAENTDDPQRLNNILCALREIANNQPVVFPAHPRIRNKLTDIYVKGITIIDPVSFLDMIALERNASVILTDSGGVQKEAYFHKVPCVTLRNETEWTETVNAGWNQIAGTNCKQIINAVRVASSGEMIEEYGQGNSADLISQILISCYSTQK